MCGLKNYSSSANFDCHRSTRIPSVGNFEWHLFLFTVELTTEICCCVNIQNAQASIIGEKRRVGIERRDAEQFATNQARHGTRITFSHRPPYCINNTLSRHRTWLVNRRWPTWGSKSRVWSRHEVVPKISFLAHEIFVGHVHVLFLKRDVNKPD